MGFLGFRCSICFFCLLGDSGFCVFWVFAVWFGSYACLATAGFGVLGILAVWFSSFACLATAGFGVLGILAVWFDSFACLATAGFGFLEFSLFDLLLLSTWRQRVLWFLGFRCRVWFFCLPDDSGICKNGDFDAQKCLWVPQKHRNLKEEEFRCPTAGHLE
ncbi:MAG: hypothetical protein IKO03_04745 [Lachnospiraceae bacterium]|nr:hypothetical protein [Lachnospiraceae bacterium]